MGPTEGLPREHRLRRRSEFLTVQKNGKRVHTRHFVVVVLPREGSDENRLGVTVTKRVAGSVGRNRVKRVVREVFRRHRHYFPGGCDVVIIAKSGADLLGYDDVRDEMARIRRRLEAAAQHRAPHRPQRRASKPLKNP